MLARGLLPLHGPRGPLLPACRHERAEKEKEELHMMLAQIMSLTNVAFFGLAGAALKLVRC